MNTLAKIKQYLDQNNVPYQVILHEEVYTAQELAQALHVPGKELVKVVIIKADDRYCMAVLPSIRKIDLSALQTQLHAATLAIATEQELKALFPETEIGAMNRLLRSISLLIAPRLNLPLGLVDRDPYRFHVLTRPSS